MIRIKAFLKKFLGRRFGTAINEWRWKIRHRKGGNDWNNALYKGEKDEWVKSYRDSTSHPHRKLVVDTIARYNPSSILEIGSNCGPNLFLLAKRFPHAAIQGTDVNEEAVKVGNAWFEKEGMMNVALLRKTFGQLNSFADESFDVVFTDAVLIYAGPDRIKDIARHLLRIAKKAIILVEWQCAKREHDPMGLGVYYGGRWKRNYANLFASLSPNILVRTKKLSHSDWPDANWSSIGYLIEVKS